MLQELAVAALTLEALEEGQQLFLEQKQCLDVRKMHFALQTLPKER